MSKSRSALMIGVITLVILSTFSTISTFLQHVINYDYQDKTQINYKIADT